MDNFELIALGEEAKHFASSKLGSYIGNAADLEIETSYVQLASIDPTDAKGIASLQNTIRIHMVFKRWIQDAIEAGNLAYSDYLTESE
jgi:hypothetical protein